MVERLTEREYQVLILVAKSKTNKEIARELHISIKTVEYHITNILGKLGAANRTEAVVKALEQRLLDPAGV
jgi:NarL family two-component system response regulator LiaR